MQRWCNNRTCRATGDNLAPCKLAELCTVHRTQPCDDYPGRWILYHAGLELYRSKDFRNTFEFAVRLGARKGELDGASICWDASEGDPRIGQVWFAGYYTHGTWDIFGQYRS